MNYFKTIILILVLSALLIWIGGMVGGRNGIVVAFAFSLVLNGLSYWFSDRIILSMYGATELPRGSFGRVYETVDKLSAKAGIPSPRVYLMESAAPNAFATGRDPKHGALCLTSGIINSLSEDELAGVISHELAHIKNRDTLLMTLAAALASAVMMIANMIRWAAVFGSRDRRSSGNAVGLLAASVVAPFAAMLIQLAISRSREYAADARGASFSGKPEGLARALEKISSFHHGMQSLAASPQTAHLFIVSPFVKKNLIISLFSTHPPVEERVRRLRSMEKVS